MHDKEQRLINSWSVNAQAWTRSVREQQIESRRLVTDQAIVSAVMDYSPRRVLDVGCGEGWLARSLAERGIMVSGFDVSPELVEKAKELAEDNFQVLSYAEFSLQPNRWEHVFDAIVCNFSLLSEDIGPVLQAAANVLSEKGVLIIQTLHPVAVANGRYEDGWREETFAGMGDGYEAAMPWYFRTLGSWLRILRESGYEMLECREPIHPQTGRPLSLLIVAGQSSAT